MYNQPSASKFFREILSQEKELTPTMINYFKGLSAISDQVAELSSKMDMMASAIDALQNQLMNRP